MQLKTLAATLVSHAVTDELCVRCSESSEIHSLFNSVSNSACIGFQMPPTE